MDISLFGVSHGYSGYVPIDDSELETIMSRSLHRTSTWYGYTVMWFDNGKTVVQANGCLYLYQ